MDLSATPVSEDTIGLLEGMATTRAIRRYTDEPIPEQALRDMLFTATRAPSGSNRQPFRFLVLTDSDKAQQAKQLIGTSARLFWEEKRTNDRYDQGSGADPNSPKSRMARVMQHYVDNFDNAPALILPCMVRYREPHTMEGASMYPAVQNLMLAARAMGYGGVITGFHGRVEDELKALLGIPEEVFIACTLTLGRPQGGHGPVRRRPMSELVFGDTWDEAPAWAVDPPGTQYTSAGPPKGVKAV
ncbi:MAG: nitroreductase family protein [Pseudomonadota bacterium]